MRKIALALFVIILTACVAPAPPSTPIPEVAITVPTVTALPTAIPSPTREKPKEVRVATGAGRWYPADKAELAAAVDAYLADGGESAGAHPLGLLVPHAGYIFSGAVAGRAFAQVTGERYDTVVIVGDTHSGNGSAEIAVYAAGGWETPLGTVLIDEEVAGTVVAADERIAFDRAAFASEHPVENQIPFLQRVFADADGNLKIVPIVFRRPTPENIALLSAALTRALTERDALIVGSTDLSHYPAYADAVRVDAATLRAIETFDPAQVVAVIEEQMRAGTNNLVTCACSQGAVLTTMRVARALGADQVAVLHYASSGDTPFGDRQQVVGYGAVVFYRGDSGGDSRGATRCALTWDMGTSAPTPPPANGPGTYTDAEKKLMLRMARETIARFLESGTLPTYVITDAALLRENGAFVTLRKKGQLRGCVGNIVGGKPLYLTIQGVAINATVNDRRFPPVVRAELDELEVEVSVLSVPWLITDTNEIEVGTHGIILVKGDHQGVFLPEVAVEQNWDCAEYLRQVCGKAGLEMTEGCWETGQIYVFTAEVFGEGADE